MLEGVNLFIIHSFLFNILFYLQFIGSERKSREPSTDTEKKQLSPSGDPNAYMQLDRCEREIKNL